MNIWTPKGRRIVKPSIAECAGLGLGLGFGGGGVTTAAFSPISVANNKAWYRGDLGASVSAWLDQSGTGDSNKNAAQGTGGIQPSLAASAAFNNQQTFTFTGTDQMPTGTWAVALAQPFTVMLVGRSLSNVGSNYAFDNLSDPTQCAVNNSAGTLQAFTTAILAPANDPLVASIIFVEFNGASSKMYVNAHTAVATGAIGAAGMSGVRFGNYAGGGAFANWDIAEWAAWSGIVSAGDRTLLEAYASARYAITVGA